MIVKELVEVLQRQDQDAVVLIAESVYDWHNVLILLTDDSNPDDALEIRVE